MRITKPWNDSGALMPDRFLVWGSGGHGKVVADLLRVLGHPVAGFANAEAGGGGCEIEPGGPRVVITEAELLSDGLPEGVDALALAIGNNSTRLARLDAVRRLNVPALVHPAAVASSTALIGDGTVVLANAVLNASARVGRGVIVNTSSVVEHDCFLGDGAHLSPGAVLAGGVRVGPLSWIGAGAVVLPGVHIGAGAIVGAGAVVTRNVPDGWTVVGNPARRLEQSA
jgi:sugar O-acyltransferase (sialic acid O-acetyltransferase NeuD family)